MEGKLTKLIENVSKSKEQAQDLYYRSTSRQINHSNIDQAISMSGDLPSQSSVTKTCFCQHSMQPGLSIKDANHKLDVVLKKVMGHMNRISSECKCYYTSCPREFYSMAERFHFDAYHNSQRRQDNIGVSEYSDVSKSQEEEDDSSLNKTDTIKSCKLKTSNVVLTGLTINKTQNSETFVSHAPPNTILNSSLMKNSRKKKMNSMKLLNTLHSKSAVNNGGCNSTASTPPAAQTSVKGRSKKKTSASKIEIDQLKLRPQVPISDNLVQIKLKDAGSCESLSSKSVHFAQSSTPQQGIFLVTKPGPYIIRKPVQNSSKHLHVQPGQFVCLNFDELDFS